MTLSAFAASPQGSLEWVVVAAFMAAGVPFGFWVNHRWARSRLDPWARREKIEIILQERRSLRRGPFDWMGQYWVFRIRARDAAGKERDGWVRLGGWFAGPWSDDAEARWDKPS